MDLLDRTLLAEEVRLSSTTSSKLQRSCFLSLAFFGGEVLRFFGLSSGVENAGPVTGMATRTDVWEEGGEAKVWSTFQQDPTESETNADRTEYGVCMYTPCICNTTTTITNCAAHHSVRGSIYEVPTRIPRSTCMHAYTHAMYESTRESPRSAASQANVGAAKRVRKENLRRAVKGYRRVCVDSPPLPGQGSNLSI